MEDFYDFLKAKFDSISLFVAMALLAFMILHLVHRDYGSNVASVSLTWAEQTFTTVLGAYIGLTQAARLSPKSNGGTNGTTTNSTTTTGTTTGH